MTNGVLVREAEEKDLGVLAKLMTELGYPTSKEDMARRFEVISPDSSYCATIFSLAPSGLSVSKLRAMIWRFISLVPSPISLILTCRQ